MSPKRIRSVSAAAWIIDDLRGGWDLCRWAFPTDSQLRDHSKPCSEARIIKVRIVPVDPIAPPANTKRIRASRAKRRAPAHRSPESEAK